MPYIESLKESMLNHNFPKHFLMHKLYPLRYLPEGYFLSRYFTLHFSDSYILLDFAIGKVK